MIKKPITKRNRILFTVFMLAGVFFLFAPADITSKLQFAFAHLFQRPLSKSRDVTLAANKQQSFANVVSLSEYLKLRNHLANNIQWLHQVHQKAEKLSGIRSRTPWEGVNFVLADIIAGSTNGSQNEFIINRGQDDGLAKGHFVLSHHSIIGTISNLDSRTARVQLLTDPASQTAVTIGKLSVRGIMQGNGNCSAKIQLLPTKYEIKMGDIVYVQKKPGLLDVSVIAGTISECKPNDENPLLWDMSVEPACNTRKICDVAVVVIDSQGQL